MSRMSRIAGLGTSTLVWLAGMAQAGAPNTSDGYNLPVGVSDLSQEIHHVHMIALWVCVAIAVAVFGAMIFSLLKFRHSQGAVPDTTMVHSTKAEIIWTVIPVVILVFMAIPAAETLIKIEDTRNSELTVRVTGYQWKWQYQYMDAAEGVSFYSTLSQDSNEARQVGSGIDPNSVPNYLLSVDHPLVIPSGAKVRLLLTSQDVIHAWWVPDFGMKRDAIPGFVNEMWIRVPAGKEGTYRGQCAELCGQDHGFMPIVVEVKSAADFKKWVDDQKAQAKQAATPAAAEAPAVKTAQVLAR